MAADDVCNRLQNLDPVLLVRIDSLASWVAEREAVLVAAEDEMFRAARDRATTDQDSAFWDDLLALRSQNRRSTHGAGAEILTPSARQPR